MSIRRKTGGYHTSTVVGDRVQAYFPRPLPPEPPLELEPLFASLGRANHALGRLDGSTALLPDTQLFIHLYLRKEAVLSSQIEGTQC